MEIVYTKKLKNILQSHKWIFLFVGVVFIRLGCFFESSFYEEETTKQEEVRGVIQTKEEGEFQTRYRVQDTLINIEDSSYQIGDVVSCWGTYQIPNSFHNFYLPSYDTYLVSRGIFHFLDGSCTLISSSPSIFYRIKRKVFQMLENRDSTPYLQAFLLGNTKQIDQSVLKDYQTLGIFHLFSLSGIHISFFFTLFASFLFSKKLRNLFSFSFFSLYLFIAGYPPSFVRASMFPFFYQITKHFSLSKRCSFVLFTGILLMIHPYLLYHRGFQFSFLLSFFYILYEDYFRSFKNPFFKSMALSLFFFLGLIPLQIQNNFSLNFFTPLYSLIFTPFITIVLFPFSVLTFFFPFLDPVYGILIQLLETVAHFLATHTHLTIFAHLSWLEVVGYYVCFIWTMHKIRKNEYTYSVGLIFLLLLFYEKPYINPKGIVLMIDVGQGDSTLIIYPHQELSILIDTGGSYYNSTLAERVLVPTLHAHGIQTLDYLILTHGDTDHAGEAIALLEQMPVRKVFFNQGSNNALEKEIMTYLRKKKIAYEQVSKKDIIVKGNRIRFLNTRNPQDENEDSIILLLSILDHPILLMGDSGIASESSLLESNLLSQIDILKVGHHGSNTSTSLEFVSKIQPKLCLISAGRNNRYHHPHATTLNHLKTCQTYVTSIVGAIKITITQTMLVQVAR